MSLPEAHSGLTNAERQLASLPIAVILVGPGLRISSINPAAEQFIGQSSRRLSGQVLTDWLDFANETIVRHLRDSETPVSGREVNVTIQGLGRRRIDLTAAPLADAPGWQLLTIHDHSAVAAMGEDSGAIGTLSFNGPEVIAHEIKNPLAGIRGAAQLLGRKVGAKNRPLTELITSEVDRIAKLIEQMQLLSGKTRAEIGPCNPHEAIRRAIAVISAAETGPAAVTISEEFDPSLPPVLANSDGLVQVLINLISNAREACSHITQPRIVVRTRFASGLQLYSAETGQAVRLSTEIRVSDNGPGVPVEMREHIFDPFVTTKKSGQGLGLALVRKLVRDMNGRVSHERDDDAGLTHFRINLPIASEAIVHSGKEVTA